MYTRNVQSDTRPAAIAYLLQEDGVAEVYMRSNIHETESDEGAGFEYDEVYFETTETQAAIEANPEVWEEYGAAWEDEKALTQEEIIARLSRKAEQNRADIDFIAAMIDVDLEV